MSSDKEKAVEALAAWKASGRIIAVFFTSGKNRIIGCGKLVDVTSSAVRVGVEGITVEIDLNSAFAFDWRAGNEEFDPLLRVAVSGYECVLFPLKELVDSE